MIAPAMSIFSPRRRPGRARAQDVLFPAWASAAAASAAPATAAAAAFACGDLPKVRLIDGLVTSAVGLSSGLPAANTPLSRGPNGSYVDPVFTGLPCFCCVFATLSPVVKCSPTRR